MRGVQLSEAARVKGQKKAASFDAAFLDAWEKRITSSQQPEQPEQLLSSLLS